MATTVKFFRDANGFYTGVGFYDHARSEDNADTETGARVCAALSVLSSYVEVLADTASAVNGSERYKLKACSEPPSKEITVTPQYDLQIPLAALAKTILLLSVQYPDFITAETVKERKPRKKKEKDGE